MLVLKCQRSIRRILKDVPPKYQNPRYLLSVPCHNTVGNVINVPYSFPEQQYFIEDNI